MRELRHTKITEKVICVYRWRCVCSARCAWRWRSHSDRDMSECMRMPSRCTPLSWVCPIERTPYHPAGATTWASRMQSNACSTFGIRIDFASVFTCVTCIIQALCQCVVGSSLKRIRVIIGGIAGMVTHAHRLSACWSLHLHSKATRLSKCEKQCDCHQLSVEWCCLLISADMIAYTKKPDAYAKRTCCAYNAYLTVHENSPHGAFHFRPGYMRDI